MKMRIPNPKKTGRRLKRPALRELETLANLDAIRRHPHVDPRYLAPRRYFDNSANLLTRCIIDWLKLNGHQAERIAVTGRVIDKRKQFRDVTGKVRQIGSVSWIPTSGTKGSADISAIINGRAVKIEIKIGRDRQSEDQKAYQRAVEEAGGVYVIARDFQQFYEWYQTEAIA